jgi:hypothetical protein
MADPDDPMVIAFHEAEHAVVAKVLGFRVNSVTRTRVSFTPLDLGPMTSQACAVFYLSGPWAEKLL